MKIAIYQPRISYYVGGGETVPLEMARLFSKHGHETTLVTSNHPSGFSEYYQNFVKENPNITFRYLELPNSLKWIYEKKPGINQLRWDLEAVHVGRLAQTFFEKNHYDILNVHYKIDILATNPSYPSVMFLHGVPAEREYFDKVWFSFGNVRYISVSEYIGRKWSEMAGGFQYKVFTNGIDTKHYHPLPDAKKDIDILYFGRLAPVKGINFLIEAVRKLVDSGLAPRTIIAGKGNEKDALYNQARKLGVDKIIEFVGYVPQEEVLSLYNRSKILVAPSFDREGILTTMLEAAACSVPTITTDSCSMPEFVDNNVNGLLAQPKDSDSLGTSIQLILKDDLLRNRLGKKAREKAETWDWEIKSKKLEEYFENIIK